MITTITGRQVKTESEASGQCPADGGKLRPQSVLVGGIVLRSKRCPNCGRVWKEQA